MKKFNLLILPVLFFCIIGCTRNTYSPANASNDKINVIATIFAPYDFVRQIAGDRVNLSMLLSPGSESHSFEPSPRDIINIMNSDVFIYTGSESDRWIDRILQSVNTDEMKILAMINTVAVLEEEIVEGMEDPHNHDDHHDHDHDDHDHDHDHDDLVYDEHVWTSPRNAIMIVRAITDILCEADNANAAYYRQNAASYIESLMELDSIFTELIAGARRRTIVFGDRFPFRYLAHDYGLEYFAAFPGCSTQTEPSAATVAFLINTIRALQIPVVFHIELSNERMADTIAGETGARKLLLHSAHNVSRDDFNAGLTYLDIMKRNAENLREALY